MNILIVDDDPVIAEGLAELLAIAGRRVIVCFDAESATIVRQSAPLDWIISDIRLTGAFRFEGLEVLQSVPGEELTGGVILMSGEITSDLRAEALRRGAVAVLQKPFEMAELEEWIGAGIAGEPAGEIVRIPPLEEVLTSNVLHPSFQTIVTLSDERIYGLESLARIIPKSFWSRPDLLFEYAERKGRMVDLELACIRQTLACGKLFPDRTTLFMNLRPSVLAAGERLVEVVLGGEVALDFLVIELTEQDTIQNRPVSLKTVETLRDAGIRFAFDDVGIAYSHLTLIDQVRPSFLKISQDFGTDFERDPTKTKLIRNLLSLAKDFEARLILEGIETSATAEAARDYGVDLGQGYYFSRPETPEVVLRALVQASAESVDEVVS